MATGNKRGRKMIVLVIILAPTNPSSSHRMEKMKSFWGSGTNS